MSVPMKERSSSDSKSSRSLASTLAPEDPSRSSSPGFRKPVPPVSQATVVPALDPNLVTWNGPNDPHNPHNWSKSYKWFLTIINSTVTMSVTFASSSGSVTSKHLMEAFHISEETTNLITTLFVAGFILGPILWAATSELVGRRPVTLITMLFFALFLIGQALAQNAATLFVTRFISGTFAAAPLTNGGGMMPDLWPNPTERGHALTFFWVMVFLGPVFGPIVGAFVDQSYLGWRWVFWVTFFLAMACWASALIFIPETFGPVLLKQKAKRLRAEDPINNKDLYAAHEKIDWSFKSVIERTIYRPFIMLSQEPILVLITIYMSLVYGLIYGTFEAYPIIWGEIRGFSESNSGLIFVGMGIGTVLGGVINYFLELKYTRLTPLWKNTPPPEERLAAGMVAGPLLVIGLFFLGWTGAYASVPWYVPALATIPLGASFVMFFMSFMNYIIECYLMFAASGLAANTIFRSIVGASFPMYVGPMFHNLGVQWACTLLGCIAILLAPLPYLFYIYGPRVRELSRFAPALDLKVRKELEAQGLVPPLKRRHGDSVDEESKA